MKPQSLPQSIDLLKYKVMLPAEACPCCRCSTALTLVPLRNSNLSGERYKIYVMCSTCGHLVLRRLNLPALTVRHGSEFVAPILTPVVKA